MTGVGFDIDHTLAIDNKLERVAFLQMLDGIVDRGGRVRSLAEESDAIDALLAQQRSGAFSIDEAVCRFVSARGAEATDDDIAWFRDTVLRMVDHFVVPDPESRFVLAELQRRGVRVAVLSNGWNPLQQRKAHRAGFDGPVIASGDLGSQKPNPLVFKALLEALGVDASDAWYVGDDARADVAGAIASGLRGVWLDNEGKTYPAGAAPPTHRITSLTALLPLLP